MLDLSRSAQARANVEDLPLPDASFDAIVCVHVLEHVSNDRRALHEFWRVLAPGGWAILQVPVKESAPETFEDPSVR